jgi:hypothetical protein
MGFASVVPLDDQSYPISERKSEPNSEIATKIGYCSTMSEEITVTVLDCPME